MTPFGSPLDDRANPIYSEGTDTRVSPSCALLVALSSPAACCCVEIVIPYVDFSVGLGMAVSPIAGRMCKISVEDVLDPPATAPAAVPTIEEPAPKRGDPVQAPGVERPAAVDSGPTAAEVAADIERAIKLRGHTRVDSPGKRPTDSISKVLNHPWRWDSVHTFEASADIASKGGSSILPSSRHH